MLNTPRFSFVSPAPKLNVLVILISLLATLFPAQSWSEEQKETTKTNENTILHQRENAVEEAVENPFSISQHRLNYILPVTYTKSPSSRSVDELNTQNIDNFEAKYQISVKFPVYLKEQELTGVYFGFTAVSYWQVYNTDVSKPFRETNYEPEVFYNWQLDYQLWGFQVDQLQLGLNHQSNGQSSQTSRSWNRLFANVVFSDASAYYYLKAWYRIKEELKTHPFDSVGDDNPDITRFLGHGEIGVGTQLGSFNLLAKLRNNLRTSNNKGSIELNFSYSINSQYDLLIQYFNGYGDSLIEYNHHQQRVGVGLQMSFL